MDVTSSESVNRAAAEIKDEAIDVLINSAGIIGAPNQTVGKVDYDSWAKVLNVNTMGPLRVIEAFTEHVARSSRKLIVTITSGMGSLADNASGGSIAYRSSKGSEHGHAQRRYRSGAARHYLRPAQPWLGEDRYGWT